jgi:hypothetical protein
MPRLINYAHATTTDLANELKFAFQALILSRRQSQDRPVLRASIHIVSNVETALRALP